MINMAVIYSVVLFLFSVQGKKKYEIEITDTPTPNPTEILHKRQTEEKENASLSDSSSANSSTEETKIDNGTALILTPYIEKSNIEEARRLSQVDSDLFLGIKSYSGFLTVNETYNSNLFFWYFPGERDENTPWIIWLQGGPGSSSLEGLFHEMGPFTVKDNDGNLNLNQYSWLQNHSLVFIDSPVGSGYSFTNHEDGFVLNMETYGSHLYSAVHQLVQLFPELQTAPLFVAGESYGGKYAPALATQIHNRKYELPKINLQGVIIGNGLIDPYLFREPTRVFYNNGWLAPEQVEELRPQVQELQGSIDANNSTEAWAKHISTLVAIIKINHIYQEYDFPVIDFDKIKYVIEKSEIKKGIHVGDLVNWSTNYTVYTTLSNADFLSSVNPLIEKLLENYDVLAYCGQLDQIVPCVTESENFRRWQWSGSNDFRKSKRSVFFHNNKRAGYVKTGGRFTEAVILRAGHYAANQEPGPLQQLVTKWTRDRNLDEN